MLPFMPFVGYYLKKILSFTKKAFIIIVVYFVIFNLFFYFINRDKVKFRTSNPIKENRKKIYQVINNPQNNATDQGKIGVTIYRTMNCWLLGEACTDNPSDGDININHSLTGFLSGIIILPLTQPPASGIYWAFSGLEKAGFIPQTYAAEGIGFASISGFSGIWLLFRNFVLLLMVIVIVAIGFMVMFRAKINPQTVISVENALPKIVISLLLITFSFAIAGFLIDLMYIVIGFIVILLKSDSRFNLAEPMDFIRGNVSLWKYLNPFGANWGNLYNVSSSLFGMLPTTIQFVLNSAIYTLLGNLIISLTGSLALPASGIGTKVIKGVAGLNPLTAVQTIFSKMKPLKAAGDAAADAGKSGQPIVSLILAIISIAITILIDNILLPFAGPLLVTLLLVMSIVFIWFRIFFMLLSVYVNTIILIILSPVILALEAIPGKGSFSSWIKNLIMNLMTFPAFILLLFIANMIMNLDTASSQFWKPPFLINFDTAAFQAIVGAFILFSIPDLIKGLKEAMGVKPMPINLGLGSMFSGATTVTSSGVGLLGQFSSISLGLGAFQANSPLGSLIRGKAPAPKPQGNNLAPATAGGAVNVGAPVPAPAREGGHGPE